ncbi:NUDIX domain-containing protein [Streptomyces xiamenensis]
MTETTETVRHTADVVAIAEGHVLLIERGWDPYAGRWALPGGHVDEGEMPREAAARELEEETGVAVPAGDLHYVGCWDAPGRDPRGRYSTEAYTVTLPELVEPTAGDDAKTARWFPLNGLPELAFDHAEIVAAAVRL